ncbi:hypothetical protein F945_01403 [Acinetobacter rudis CIP 110305]|uniref:DUF7079 domain-containing protein n=2 Tax=Acinetobacter rudis TaxID=632955 RepID=S3P6Y1_9GAMM|nr:hypothetical protein F945_01403 [Acinetobacter rudis CIP 110305]
METNMNIEDLWFSLSDLFVDNEIDCKLIADQILDYDAETIEFHLFYNVAPVCSLNLEQMIPTIWAGFSKDELIKDIQVRGISSRNQITWKKKLAAKLYKFKYRKDWELLKSFLKDK